MKINKLLLFFLFFPLLLNGQKFIGSYTKTDSLKVKIIKLIEQSSLTASDGKLIYYNDSLHFYNNSEWFTLGSFNADDLRPTLTIDTIIGDSVYMTYGQIDTLFANIIYGTVDTANLWKGLDTTYFIRNVDTTVTVPGLGQFLDSLSNHLISINLKLNKSDTTGLSDRINLKLNLSDGRDTVIQVLTDLNYIDSTLLSDSLALKMDKTAFNDSANQFKTDSQLVTLSQMNDTNNTYGHWDTTGSDIYYNDGNVGLGTNTPTTLLHLETQNDLLAPFTISNSQKTIDPRLAFDTFEDAQGFIAFFGENYYFASGTSAKFEVSVPAWAWLMSGRSSDVSTKLIHYQAGSMSEKNMINVKGSSYTDIFNISVNGYIGIRETLPLTYLHTNISESGTTPTDYDGILISNSDATTGNLQGIGFGQSSTDKSLSAFIIGKNTDRTGASEDTHLEFYTLDDGSQKLTALFDSDSTNLYIDGVKKMWLNSLGLHLADTLYLGATSSKLWDNNDTLTTNVFEADNYIRNDSTIDQIIAEQATCGLSVWAKKSGDIDADNAFVTITSYASLSSTTFAWTGPAAFSSSNKSDFAFSTGEYQLVGTNGSCTDTAFVTVNGNTVIQDFSGSTTRIPNGYLDVTNNLTLNTSVILSNSGDDLIIVADTVEMEIAKANEFIFSSAKTYYHSINATNITTSHPDADDINKTNTYFEVSSGSASPRIPIQGLPNGAIIDSCIVYGTATGKSWYFQYIDFAGNASATMTANIGTSDDSPNHTINNNNYSYLIVIDDLINSDGVIYGVKISCSLTEL